MFSQAKIKKLFEPYIFVAFYTDRVPNEFYDPEVQAQLQGVKRQINDAGANEDFLLKKFETIRLPLYLILEPHADSDQVDVVGIYNEGLINNVSAFAEFLRKPEGTAAAKHASR